MNFYRDTSERVPYDQPEIPIYIRQGQLSRFPDRIVPSHWHDDVEFAIAQRGQMRYNVNGKIYLLQEGEGIFINARQLHYNFFAATEDCEYLCVLLHPILLCSGALMEERYVQPVLANTGFACQALSPTVPWQALLLSLLERLPLCKGKETEHLQVLGLFSEIWTLLYENAPLEPLEKQAEPHSLSALRDMIGYIQKQYANKISLGEIAAAGRVCKSKCCTLFRHYLHQTPIAYLTEYRLSKSVSLLLAEKLSITDIAYAVGFQGASYYSEIFRRGMGCTPTEFRKSQT